MKKRAYQHERKRIEALADKWIKPLGLAWWDIEIHFYACRKDWEKHHSHNAALATDVDWRYATAVIDVLPQLTKTMDDDRLEWGFVHELMHIFLNELKLPGDERYDKEERVASTLAKGIIWLRDALVKEYKNGKEQEETRTGADARQVDSGRAEPEDRRGLHG